MTITDERRLVTVLFADLVGFTGRAENSDPEAVRELQRAYFGAVTAEVVRFGGTLEKYIGDAAWRSSARPQAHDDDAERALRSALAIREGVIELDGALEVRIGVNTGEVVGGPAGPQQGDYTVSGDAVNVAARLQQTAAPGRDPRRRHDPPAQRDAFAFAPLRRDGAQGPRRTGRGLAPRARAARSGRGCTAVRRGSSAASASSARWSPRSRRRAMVAG